MPDMKLSSNPIIDALTLKILLPNGRIAEAPITAWLAAILSCLDANTFQRVLNVMEIHKLDMQGKLTSALTGKEIN